MYKNLRLISLYNVKLSCTDNCNATLPAQLKIRKIFDSVGVEEGGQHPKNAHILCAYTQHLLL